MPDGLACPTCGTFFAPGLLSCPGCGRLVYADRLKTLSAEAQRAEGEGALTDALAAWREALELLPPTTRQYQVIAARIAELGRRVDQAASAATAGTTATAGRTSTTGAGKAGLAGLGVFGLALLKSKFLIVFLLTKAKFLILGLTKASTLFSMLLSVGVYWAAFGWWFALGIVLSIYVHEMGHVFALTRYGIKAGAPLFVPGLGAFIRLKQVLTDPRQDARVGLAGPLWGLGAALAAYGMSLAFDSSTLAAIARFGGWVNLFNLLPIWQLDGGRAFHALSRADRWLAAAGIATAWALSGESLLILLLIAATFRAISEPPPARPDRGSLALYLFLVATLTALTLIPVRLPG